VKEEESLHRLLREHGDQGRELMHQLEAQHLAEYRLGDELRKAWSACAAGAIGADPALAALQQAVEALAAHVWQHMAQEEESLLPLALQVLGRDDWREVAETFESNRDPGFGEWSEEDFHSYFTRVANEAQLPQAPLLP
jgi:hemerythrin-like domain-containing protein